MTHSSVKISLIVATYCPGDAVNRLIDSLDAQTMPSEEFEVVFVDDGSPDDTVDRLTRIAATRPHMSVQRIENSGWPSRPRNIGIAKATGEYLMFVDHDDSLFPDGLRRAYDYARAHDADILSPKESKTDDVWWGLDGSGSGNIANVLDGDRVRRLLPMVPHKLYRRSMVLDHGIRFPEGRRVLWEDWFINVEAYRHASVVSIFEDQPVYLWHASDSNTSHTFNPARVDFWDRLEEMMAHLDATLSGPEFAEDRAVLMKHNLRVRVIDRCVRLIGQPGLSRKPAQLMAMRRARRLLQRFGTADLVDSLSKRHRVLAQLIEGQRMSLIREFHEADLASRGSLTASAVAWDEGVLHFDAVATWGPESASAPMFETSGGRVVRAVSRSMRRAVAPELLDHTDDVGLNVDVALRARLEHVTRATPLLPGEAAFDTSADGALRLVQHRRGSIDIGTADLGRPLDSVVWDLHARVGWNGMSRRSRLRYSGPTLPALVRGRAAVAYANTKKSLTLDLAQRLRTLAVDAKPAPGNAGPVASFRVALTEIALDGAVDVGAGQLYAVPDTTVDDAPPAERLDELAESGALDARLVSDGNVAELVGAAALSPGRYRVHARREGKLRRTAVTFDVGDDGDVVVA